MECEIGSRGGKVYSKIRRNFLYRSIISTYEVLILIQHTCIQGGSQNFTAIVQNKKGSEVIARPVSLALDLIFFEFQSI